MESVVHLNVITFNHFLFVLQLLRMVTASEKRWRARSRGGGTDGWSDEGDEGFESGDCDDEDECTGVSGLGPPPRRKRLRIFAGMIHTNCVVSDEFMSWAVKKNVLGPSY